jgi:hypothetical protein
MKSLRPYLLLSISLVFLLGACAGGPSEDQQATLVAVAVSAALTDSAADVPTADDGEAAPVTTAEAPAAATEAAPTDAPPTVAPPPTPVVVFQAAGSFSDAEKDQLRQRVVQPFVMYYADLAEHPTLVSFSLEKMDIAGYPYGADAIFEGGVTAGFLISNNSAPVDWWYPDCLGPCPFSDAFRAAYPEIIAIVEP